MVDSTTFAVLRVQLCAVIFLSGCASVDPSQDYRQAAQAVQTATGIALSRESLDSSVEDAVRERLQNGLTLRDALEIILLSNPVVQSSWLRIGVARADWVQAGLLSNPTLDALLRFPSAGGLSNIDLGLSQSLLDALQRPTRRAAAEARLQSEVAAAALATTALLARGTEAYYACLAADQRTEVARENVEIATQLVSLARARREVGEDTTVALNTALTERIRLQLEWLRLQQDQLACYEQMSELLALSGTERSFQLNGSLPGVPVARADTDRGNVESLCEEALRQRLDVAAANATVEAQSHALKQQRWSRWGSMSLIGNYEREARSAGQPTQELRGAGLSWSVPLFDRGQAQIARGELELRQAQLQLEAVRLRAVREVRIAHGAARMAEQRLRIIAEQLLPAALGNLELAREAYSLGEADAALTQAALRACLESRLGAVDARETLALQRNQLSLALGRPWSRHPSKTASGSANDGNPTSKLLEDPAAPHESALRPGQGPESNALDSDGDNPDGTADEDTHKDGGER